MPLVMKSVISRLLQAEIQVLASRCCQPCTSLQHAAACSPSSSSNLAMAHAASAFHTSSAAHGKYDPKTRRGKIAIGTWGKIRLPPGAWARSRPWYRAPDPNRTVAIPDATAALFTSPTSRQPYQLPSVASLQQQKQIGADGAGQQKKLLQSAQ